MKCIYFSNNTHIDQNVTDDLKYYYYNLDEWCSTNKEKPTTTRVPLKLYNDEKKEKGMASQ